MQDQDATPATEQPESYKKIKVLGKGSFGKAFLVQAESDGVSNTSFRTFFQSYAVIKKIDI